MPEKPQQVALNLEIKGDQFAHAWYFNRFRVDKMGSSYVATFGFAAHTGGVLAVNAVVLEETDIEHNRDRAMQYLGQLSEVKADEKMQLVMAMPPERIYPVNHMNLARANNLAEIGFYRFSVSSLVDAMRTQKGKQEIKSLPCYPVVMYRSDLAVQVNFLKELYTK